MKLVIFLYSALVLVAARPDDSSLYFGRDLPSNEDHSPYHYTTPPVPPPVPYIPYRPTQAPKYGTTTNVYGGVTTPKYTHEDPHAEPANYSFRYDVKEKKDDLEFGHQEQRQGDNAQGKYYVLHPDGRLMTVVYTATWKGGYVPMITFDEPRLGFPRPPKNRKPNGYYPVTEGY